MSHPSPTRAAIDVWFGVSEGAWYQVRYVDGGHEDSSDAKGGWQSVRELQGATERQTWTYQLTAALEISF